MLIAERLISRSSVALSVSIGYARSSSGRGGGSRSRSPDDDSPNISRTSSLFPLPHQLQIFIAAVRGSRDPAWFPLPCDTGQWGSVAVP